MPWLSLRRALGSLGIEFVPIPHRRCLRRRHRALEHGCRAGSSGLSHCGGRLLVHRGDGTRSRPCRRLAGGLSRRCRCILGRPRLALKLLEGDLVNILGGSGIAADGRVLGQHGIDICPGISLGHGILGASDHRNILGHAPGAEETLKIILLALLERCGGEGGGAGRRTLGVTLLRNGMTTPHGGHGRKDADARERAHREGKGERSHRAVRIRKRHGRNIGGNRNGEHEPAGKTCVDRT